MNEATEQGTRAPVIQGRQPVIWRSDPNPELARAIAAQRLLHDKLLVSKPIIVASSLSDIHRREPAGLSLYAWRRPGIHARRKKSRYHRWSEH